jgi:predicted ribosome quality control (RQC) complex YloA/Tae2 family protein
MARLAALQRWRADHREWFPDTPPKTQRRRDASGPEEPLRPFRRYLIDGRWEVWVGRSNQENDELTHRASHPADLWLHAQGVPGSHVILRTQGHPEQIPHRVLEKAAGLAALHSKARHSGLVPVVFTERRYVRKPRKTAPGIAVCQREKTLFVAPAVAEGVVLA